MIALRRAPNPDLAALAAHAEAAHREAEHACQAVQSILAAVQALADRAERIETAVRRIDGRIERLELYLLRVDPAYPVSQSVLPPDELERHRARLEAALTGGGDAHRD